jgi:hypothetical protein
VIFCRNFEQLKYCHRNPVSVRGSGYPRKVLKVVRGGEYQVVQKVKNYLKIVKNFGER